MSIEVVSRRDKEKLTRLVRWTIIVTFFVGYNVGFAMGWWLA